MSKGNQPWAKPGVTVVPTLELDAFEAGVWALCCGCYPVSSTAPAPPHDADAAHVAGGVQPPFQQLVVAGSEEGEVACWGMDFRRTPQASLLWRCCVAAQVLVCVCVCVCVCGTGAKCAAQVLVSACGIGA